MSKLPLSAQYYVAAVTAIGVLVLLWTGTTLAPAALLEALPFIFLAGVASTMRVRLLPLALKSKAPRSGAAEMSVAFAFGYAAILHTGTAAGVLAALISGLTSTLLVRQKRHPVYRIAFNCASLVLSAAVGAELFLVLGGQPGGTLTTRSVVAIAGSTYVYYLVNTMSVALAVALAQRLPFWSTWAESFLWTAAPGYFVGAVAAVALNAYYAKVQVWAFVVTLPALYLSYRSYKAYVDKVEETQQRLEEVQALYKESLQLVTQAEKLASIGRLAGGVAHEINNPLMVILGRAELALMDLEEDHAASADLEIIVSETKRIANIVKNLLRFSRQDQQESLLPVEVNEIVDRAVELTRYQMTVDNVEVETRYASVLPAVLGNAGQLQQVFTNMIINAYQAIGNHGGRLVITTRSRSGMVEILFEDTGCGIAPEHIKRIFEPFYTTKAEQEGTGLGLSVSYGIITDHGGEVRVESEIGRGSAFTVSIPSSPDIDLKTPHAATDALPVGATA